MVKRRSTFMLTLSLVISSTILLQMGLYLVSILAGWNMKFNFVAFCHGWLKAFGLTFLEYALDALVICTLAFFVWRISAQWIQTARLKKQLERYRDHKLTAEINQDFAKNTEEIMVLSHPIPLAITIGLFQPCIIITTGLIRLLDSDELQAVLYHEMFHKKSRDPLRAFVLSLGASMFRYIPIQNWLHQKYRAIQEVLADDFAITQQETTVHLGGALLKMLKAGRVESMTGTYVSFADTAVHERIECIMDPERVMPLCLPYRKTAFSITIFSVISGLFMYALS